jgi:hypothetical protein
MSIPLVLKALNHLPYLAATERQTRHSCELLVKVLRLSLSLIGHIWHMPFPLQVLV